MLARAALIAALSCGPAAACVVDGAAAADFPASVVVDTATQGRVTRAWFDDATTRYAHGILGDAIEAETLVIYGFGPTAPCGSRITLDAGHVFEDVAPRLADMDGDGTNEVIVVRTSLTQGAQIAVYGLDAAGTITLRATTPYMGQPNRWIAPVGAADLDGDGSMDIAAIEKPHLNRILRIWRWQDGALVEVAAAQGLTNHRIGETDIGGGIRDCGPGPEIVVASRDWSRTVAVRLTADGLSARDIGAYRGRESFAAALACAR